MRPVCPRCAGPLAGDLPLDAPALCPDHGAVDALHPPLPAASLAQVAALARVPVWVPDPAPFGWGLTGVRSAGRESRGWTAVVVGLSGPHPLGGDADLLLIAEEPGVGVGCRYAGLSGPDPGGPFRGPADAEVSVPPHNARLWACTGTLPDRVAYVGEAAGLWLWMVVVPAAADLVLLDLLRLSDARQVTPDLPVASVRSGSIAALTGPGAPGG
jgi:hypothetical protein